MKLCLVKANPPSQQELYAAAKLGNIEEVKSVLNKYKDQELKPDRGTLATAIKSGSVPLGTQRKLSQGVSQRPLS